MPSLLFILPMLLAYEIGVARLGGTSPELLRTGVDRWMREALSMTGIGVEFVAPLAVVGLLVAWMIAAGPRTWAFRPSWLLGMAVESVLLAAALIGLSRLVDRGLTWLEGQPVLLMTGVEFDSELAPLIGFLGAGIYEEALFRLALIPVLYWVSRIVQAPDVLAGTLAVTGSSLAFSIAHHAGVPGEVFTWYAFVFRWLAGVLFAWIFLVRGFGIAVGTHVAYDVLVGYAGWGG